MFLRLWSCTGAIHGNLKFSSYANLWKYVTTSDMNFTDRDFLMRILCRLKVDESYGIDDGGPVTDIQTQNHIEVPRGSIN